MSLRVFLVSLDYRIFGRGHCLDYIRRHISTSGSQ